MEGYFLPVPLYGSVIHPYPLDVVGLVVLELGAEYVEIMALISDVGFDSGRAGVTYPCLTVSRMGIHRGECALSCARHGGHSRVLRYYAEVTTLYNQPLTLRGKQRPLEFPVVNKPTPHTHPPHNCAISWLFIEFR